MKLLIATPLYPPEIGGPATYSKALENGLPGLGVDSTSSPHVEVELVKFSEVRHLPKLIRHYAYYRRVLRAARSADVVLALDPVSVGLPAMKAAKRAKKPFVVKVVGDYAWEQGRQRFGVTANLDEFVRLKKVPAPVRVLQKVQTRVAAAATRVIVPSEYLKGIVVSWGVPADKISVIYNAIPAGASGAVPPAVERLPRPLIVTAGRLVPWKHIDGVIDAVQKLQEKGISASLVVVGDGPLRRTLESKAHAQLGAAAVLTGTLSHPDTLAVIKSADAFVLNSSYEGLSHLLIEALSLGAPIVATRVGGNPEVVSDGETGLLVPAGDTPAFADALARLLGDAPLRERFAANARTDSGRFAEPTMLAATAALLMSLRNPS